MAQPWRAPLHEVVHSYRHALELILEEFPGYDLAEARYQFARSFRNTDSTLTPEFMGCLLYEEFGIQWN